MWQVKAIIGHVDAPGFGDRTREQVRLDADTATRRRQLVVSEAGNEVAIDLPHGAYLRHGAVLGDDGRTILVVERKSQRVMAIRLTSSDPSNLIAAAARIGHCFGNQHAPIEVAGGTIFVPVTTSPTVMAASLERLGLEEVAFDFRDIPLGLDRPLSGGHAH